MGGACDGKRRRPAGPIFTREKRPQRRAGQGGHYRTVIVDDGCGGIWIGHLRPCAPFPDGHIEHGQCPCRGTTFKRLVILNCMTSSSSGHCESECGTWPIRRIVRSFQRGGPRRVNGSSAEQQWRHSSSCSICNVIRTAGVSVLPRHPTSRPAIRPIHLTAIHSTDVHQIGIGAIESEMSSIHHMFQHFFKETISI